MINKFLVCCSNVFMASLLVMIFSSQQVVAQDSVTTVATNSGEIKIPLTGTGMVLNGGSLSITPGRINAGMVEIGFSSTQTFTIQNTSAFAVQITDSELFGESAPDFATNFNGYTSLAGNQSLDVSMTFTPLTPGAKAAGLRLTVAGSTSPYVVLFTGEAHYSQTSNLSITPEKIEFGQVMQNATANQRFILKNEGSGGAPAITVSAIQLSGTNPGLFNFDFTPVTLAVGEQMDVQAQLQTGTLSYKSAQMEIFHDGNNASLEVDIDGTVIDPNSALVNFDISVVASNQQITGGTSLQFGPDNRLYVTEKDGLIHVFDVARAGKNNYTVVLFETIDLIKNVQNHNDDGSLSNLDTRLLTGIYVTGTAAQPIIYAASSDPRMGAGPNGTDTDLDTNSGILHKLTRVGGAWSKLDLVRGLPRSEENHVANGLVLVDNKIYVNLGGNTNMGVPSNNFAELSEVALSAATLVIDLGAIGNSTYDLPTLDAPINSNDPFGGQDGLNQAMLVEGGPVQIFATGLRNAYDIIYTESGRFYVWDNGPNNSWGGTPTNTCLNTINDTGVNRRDGLHLISQGYYAGHPNPTRGNKSNTFGGQSPIEGAANPVECDYLIPGEEDGALTTNYKSTNGLAEYTASNFENAMKGDLLAVSYGDILHRVELNDSGDQVTSKSILQADLGGQALDVIARGDNETFPGTIWIVHNIFKSLMVMEPSDF